MLQRALKYNINKKEEFYKEYSKNPLYKKLILKLRRLENKFYVDVRDISEFKARQSFYATCQPRMIDNLEFFVKTPLSYLKMMKDDYETQLLKLQFRTLIDIYSKFGYNAYKDVAKDYEYIIKLNEDIFNIKLHKL